MDIHEDDNDFDITEEDYDEEILNIQEQTLYEDKCEKIFYNIKEYLQREDINLLSNLNMIDLFHFLYPEVEKVY